MTVSKLDLRNGLKSAREAYFEMAQQTVDGTKTIIDRGAFYELVDYVPSDPQKTVPEMIEEIRGRREGECFKYINRGGFWYETLTEDQKTELREWYMAWLDATDTLVIPEKPSWLE